MRGPAPERIVTTRGRIRRLGARLLFATVALGQLYFIQRADADPHKHFAFRPFQESDTFRADIVRVTRDGRRISVRQPWAGYRWGELVRERGLDHPERLSHASSGARSVIAFLDEALDWVAEHTPRDQETHYYAAEVTYFHNRRGPFHVSLRSRTRSADEITSR